MFSLWFIHMHYENRFVQCVIVFLTSFVYPLLEFLLAAGRVFLKKEENAYPTGSSSPCSQFLGESELLIYFCCFVRISLVISCSLLCVSVFNVWSLFLDINHLISARILVTLITFWIHITWKKSTWSKYLIFLSERWIAPSNYINI